MKLPIPTESPTQENINSHFDLFLNFSTFSLKIWKNHDQIWLAIRSELVFLRLTDLTDGSC